MCSYNVYSSYACRDLGVLVATASTRLQSAFSRSAIEDLQHSARGYKAKDRLQCKKRRLDLIYDACEALSSDDVSIKLNVHECHCNETGEQLLIITAKDGHYHEPAKYMYLSHLKLVVTSSSIQVRVDDYFTLLYFSGWTWVQVLFKIVERNVKN